MGYNNGFKVSIDSDDDEYDYDGFHNFMIENTKRNKKSFADEINRSGEYLLFDVDKNKAILKDKKKDYVSYILKHSKSYTEEELYRYDISDIITIYNGIKDNRKNKIKKIYDFFFGR